MKALSGSIGFGLVGTGVIAHNHAQAILALARQYDLQLVGVLGRSAAKAREFARILADEAAHEGDDARGILPLEFGDVGQARMDFVFGLLANDDRPMAVPRAAAARATATSPSGSTA